MYTLYDFDSFQVLNCIAIVVFHLRSGYRFSFH